MSISPELLIFLGTISSGAITALITLWIRHAYDQKLVQRSNDAITLQNLLSKLPHTFMHKFFALTDFGDDIDFHDATYVKITLIAFSSSEFTFVDHKLEKALNKLFAEMQTFYNLINDNFSIAGGTEHYRLPRASEIGSEKYNQICLTINQQANSTYLSYSELIATAKKRIIFSPKSITGPSANNEG